MRQASNSCPDPGEPENGKRHGNDFRYNLYAQTCTQTLNHIFVFRHRCTYIKKDMHLHKHFYSCFSLCLTPYLLSVCDYVYVRLRIALAVWCSSVAEKTMFFRAVKPSAAREWPKSSPPGVTTDQSVKVRNSSQHASAQACKLLTPQLTDTDGERGSNHRCEGKKTLKHNSPCTLPQNAASVLPWPLLSMSLCWSVEKIPIQFQASSYEIMKQNTP